jgi:hypothetical protein
MSVGGSLRGNIIFRNHEISSSNAISGIGDVGIRNKDLHKAKLYNVL